MAFCAVQAVIYTYVTTTFLSFFVSTSLQFDAIRIYMKGLIKELDDAIVNRVNGFEMMLRDIVRTHVAMKESVFYRLSVYIIIIIIITIVGKHSFSVAFLKTPPMFSTVTRPSKFSRPLFLCRQIS